MSSTTRKSRQYIQLSELLIRLELAPTRAFAEKLISEGRVKVCGSTALSGGMTVASDESDIVLVPKQQQDLITFHAGGSHDLLENQPSSTATPPSGQITKNGDPQLSSVPVIGKSKSSSLTVDPQLAKSDTRKSQKPDVPSLTASTTTTLADVRPLDTQLLLKTELSGYVEHPQTLSSALLSSFRRIIQLSPSQAETSIFSKFVTVNGVIQTDPHHLVKPGDLVGYIPNLSVWQWLVIREGLNTTEVIHMIRSGRVFSDNKLVLEPNTVVTLDLVRNIRILSPSIARLLQKQDAKNCANRKKENVSQVLTPALTLSNVLVLQGLSNSIIHVQWLCKSGRVHDSTGKCIVDANQIVHDANTVFHVSSRRDSVQLSIEERRMNAYAAFIAKSSNLPVTPFKKLPSFHEPMEANLQIAALCEFGRDYGLGWDPKLGAVYRVSFLQSQNSSISSTSVEETKPLLTSVTDPVASLENVDVVPSATKVMMNSKPDSNASVGLIQTESIQQEITVPNTEALANERSPETAHSQMEGYNTAHIDGNLQVIAAVEENISRESDNGVRAEVAKSPEETDETTSEVRVEEAKLSHEETEETANAVSQEWGAPLTGNISDVQTVSKGHSATDSVKQEILETAEKSHHNDGHEPVRLTLVERLLREKLAIDEADASALCAAGAVLVDLKEMLDCNSIIDESVAVGLDPQVALMRRVIPRCTTKSHDVAIWPDISQRELLWAFAAISCFVCNISIEAYACGRCVDETTALPLFCEGGLIFASSVSASALLKGASRVMIEKACMEGWKRWKEFLTGMPYKRLARHTGEFFVGPASEYFWPLLGVYKDEARISGFLDVVFLGEGDTLKRRRYLATLLDFVLYVTDDSLLILKQNCLQDESFHKTRIMNLSKSKGITNGIWGAALQTLVS